MLQGNGTNSVQVWINPCCSGGLEFIPKPHCSILRVLDEVIPQECLPGALITSAKSVLVVVFQGSWLLWGLYLVMRLSPKSRIAAKATFYWAVKSSSWCVHTLAAIKACKHSERENERVNACVFSLSECHLRGF